MKNKILSYVTGAAALATLCVLPTGCIQDDVNGTRETTLTLTVATRSDDPNQTDNGGKTLEANEEMKTLRVIVARHSNSEIIYNIFEDEIADDDYLRTINFSELTISTDGEDFDFYAIANENSFLNDEESLEGKNIDLKQLKELIISNDFNTTNAGNIPQTAFATVTVVPGTTDDFTMQLEFVVAKVNVQFINETGVEQPISDLHMADVSPNQGYLFNNDKESIYIPTTGLNYSNLTLAESVTVPTGTNNTAEVRAYLYPGEAKDYTLTATWNGKEQTVNCNEAIGSGLDRGQQLNIVVTLTAEYDYTTNVMVNAWTEKSMNIPAFE